MSRQQGFVLNFTVSNLRTPAWKRPTYGDRGVPKFIIFMLLAVCRSRLRGLLGMHTQPKTVQNQIVKAM